MLILIAARQAMVAAIPRRRSSSETLLQLALGDLENLKHQLFDFGRAHARRARLSPRWCGCRKAPNRSRNAPVRPRCAHIRSAAPRVRSSKIGIRSCWRSTRPWRLLAQHFLEQNPLMRDVLVDDPQPVASGRDDEAVVNLAKRAKIGERGEALRSFRDRAAIVRHACPARRTGESARNRTRLRRGGRVQREDGKVLDALRRQRRRSASARSADSRCAA